MVLTKLNIAWAYFDIANFNGLPYLNFINKHHSKFGNESTIVALNMLNGMYYCYKNEPKKATLFFETIARGISDENQIYHLHIKNTKFLLKMQNLKKHLEPIIISTTALNDEDKQKKINVAGINLSWMNIKREVDVIETK
jgi:hypothetical protein